MKKGDGTESDLLEQIKLPLVLAPMAGIVNVEYAKRFESDIGLAFLGGFSIDDKTMKASRRMVERGRKEFIFDDPLKGIEKELKKSENCTFKVGINVRGVDPDSYLEIAGIAREYGTIVEINAHCRQPEIMELGAGQSLLSDLEKLGTIVRLIKDEGAIVSVKFRSGIIDEEKIIRVLKTSGADIIHVDAMGDRGYNLDVLRKMRNLSDILLIGNNSVRTPGDALKMFSCGVDMISIARASLNGNVFREIREKLGF